ncbi:MAG: protocatechuate 4,5-dioxygenase subunit alpha [Woeseia sp.]|jgi:protocatechuate 4,5-dioxygenase, alpha chain|nr:protocatechuate 4,5-dioxygenase subunit alpha [Woeseia sp.]MDE0754364.1 protocatechuate 4,5-dioxygenase subunit alpha [Woeseiaceae bacterium]
MSKAPDFSDIPGTYVLDKEHSRKGYQLNMFCMSLNEQVNRDAFREDEAAYLERYPLTPEQRHAVLDRDWLGLLKLGGNVYYTFKIAAFDRISMQAMGGAMCDMTEDEFKEVMLTGGKDAHGHPRRGPNVLEKDGG